MPLKYPAFTNHLLLKNTIQGRHSVASYPGTSIHLVLSSLTDGDSLPPICYFPYLHERWRGPQVYPNPARLSAFEACSFWRVYHPGHRAAARLLVCKKCPLGGVRCWS